ncbi:LamG domain-containing protein [Actinoplanes sp. NPDC026670]|uniref:LamG domain-containing protein n=1 Tax=Actinoplanes sp. NPDC026670 TaxID=3154700 RepID=UPI00340B1B62
MSPADRGHSDKSPADRGSGAMSAVPNLDDVAGEWVHADDLGHLPSLRNQRGQAHVNHDLTSISWLAAPPFTGGYHTGTLTVDGTAVAAQRFLWKPWGVRREHRGDTVTVVTDTRMAYEKDLLLWRVTVTNNRPERAVVEIGQDLYAPIAHSTTGWGWLHTVPWNGHDEHDYHGLERIRETTRGDRPWLLGAGPRRLRLGRPRLPGIQRDEDSAPMLLEFELPRHVSADTVYPHRSSVRGAVRGLPGMSGIVQLDDQSEVTLGTFALVPGRIAGEVRLDDAGHDGVLFTHGNTPDSLQVGVEDGRLWLGISGEREIAGEPLTEGRWHAFAVDVTDDHVTLRVDGAEVVRTGHWARARRWRATLVDGTVTVSDTRSPARAAYAFAVPPDVVLQGAGARAVWRLDLGPGETADLGFVCAFGTGDVAVAAQRAADDLDREFAATEDGWRRLWRAAFTPGNESFSGHLPTLTTPDADLGRAYYMAALLALYLRSTTAGRGAPMFLTGGPRLGATTTYFWDHTEWSRMYALLDPAGLREWLVRALSGPYEESFGFDLWGGGPLGNFYIANDYALFQLVEHYVGVTGDVEFLSSRAGARTVLEHVERLAYGFADRRTTATGGVLADFGPDAWTVLECVPGYVHAMASFNAAYVKMLRSYAALLRHLGDPDGAVLAERQSAIMATAVLGLYAGGGRWHIAGPGGRTTIGHVLDFGLVTAALADHLPPSYRDEMVDFVSEALLAGPWMRALAADDPMAPHSDRPDHGAGGAFCAWPGVTAYGLARLGRRDLAAAVLGRTPRAASGGLWGQAMEIVPGSSPARVRVAGRGVANRDSIAGAAIGEAVIAGLFGVEPGYHTLGPARPASTVTVPGLGSLANLNLQSQRGRPLERAHP